MYKREDIIIVPIQTFPLSILAFSPLPPRHQVTSRDNHWWRQSLAYVVKDGVWYTFRGENFYYRNVGANASPPLQQKVFVFWRGNTAPLLPSFFGAYVSRRKMLENQSSHFLKISWKPLRFASWFRTLISCSPNLPNVYIRLCIDTETILHFFNEARSRNWIWLHKITSYVINLYMLHLVIHDGSLRKLRNVNNFRDFF